MDIPNLLDGRLKLRHLVLVDALSHQGSMVGAAAALHITQPAISRALQELESILNVSLYERNARGVVPTVFGDIFTEHARGVIGQLNYAARHLAEVSAADYGTVAVGTHLAGSNALLPRAISEVKKSHPLLTVVVREASPTALVTDLAAGRIDLILGRITGQKPEGMERTSLYKEPMKIVVSSAHPHAKGGENILPRLFDFPWIVPGSETLLRRELEDFFGMRGLSLPANRIESTSFLTIRHLVLQSNAVAVLPALIALEDNRLSTLPISLRPIGYHVGMTTVADRPLSPSLHAIVSALRSVAESMDEALG